MSAFVGQLKLRAFSPEEIKASGGSAALFQLIEDFSFQSDVFGLITAPAGMITDFASIPAAALWYIDDDSPRILMPSIIHDFLYGVKGQLPDGRPALARADADELLRSGMILCGARAAQARAVWASVRMFGGAHWK